MKFRTNLNINEIDYSLNTITYSGRILLMGSCFVENMGKRLSHHKFDAFINPFGILFNPKAIEKVLEDIVQKKKYTQADLVFENERWHSLHHHSDFSNRDSAVVLHKINTRISKTKDYLQNTSHLIITLGTAWVYHHIKTDQLIANCHKIPQSNFIKRLLSVSEITTSLERIIELVHSSNPSVQVLLTLSPVRHLKDGMLANSQSKAHLLTAIHQVSDSSNACYFPSYEILLDDLRDYRFYSSDMLHPNKTAIDYIWSIFKEVWIDSSVYRLMDEVAQIQKGLLHKAFNPESKEYQEFVENIETRKRKLKNEYGIVF